jgi:hypothetical protein
MHDYFSCQWKNGSGALHETEVCFTRTVQKKLQRLPNYLQKSSEATLDWKMAAAAALLTAILSHDTVSLSDP